MWLRRVEGVWLQKVTPHSDHRADNAAEGVMAMDAVFVRVRACVRACAHCVENGR